MSTSPVDHSPFPVLETTADFDSAITRLINAARSGQTLELSREVVALHAYQHGLMLKQSELNERYRTLYNDYADVQKMRDSMLATIGDLRSAKRVEFSHDSVYLNTLLGVINEHGVQGLTERIKWTHDVPLDRRAIHEYIETLP